MGKPLAIILAGLVLTVGWRAAQAQDGETEMTKEERVEQLTESLDYQLLLERQKSEAGRRNEIRAMQGDAELQTAHTAQLNALADNCEARKAAVAAGVDVPLCAGDEAQAEAVGSAQAALELVAGRIDVVEKLEQRLAALESGAQQPAAAASAVSSAPAAAVRAQGAGAEDSEATAKPTMKRWLIFVDEARAVIRQEHPDEGQVEGDVSLRIPFDATRSGTDCIALRRSINDIDKNSRICRNWRDSSQMND